MSKLKTMSKLTKADELIIEFMASGNADARYYKGKTKELSQEISFLKKSIRQLNIERTTALRQAVEIGKKNLRQHFEIQAYKSELAKHGYSVNQLRASYIEFQEQGLEDATFETFLSFLRRKYETV